MYKENALRKEDFIINTKFGPFYVKDVRKYHFPGGLFGFVQHFNWYLIIDEKADYFCYLQSLEEDQAGFIILNKDLCFPDYPLDFHQENLPLLNLTDGQSLRDCHVFFIVNIPPDLSSITINLKSPILFNRTSERGIQAISVHDEMLLKQNLDALIQHKLLIK